MNFLQVRGAVPLLLDKQRTVFFSMYATGLLVDRFGMNFATELYSVKKLETELDIRMKNVDNLCFFLWAGLQHEAREAGETLTLAQTEDFIRPLTVKAIFGAVMKAFLSATVTPEEKENQPVGKNQPVNRIQKGPGPTKVSTSMKRRGLR